MANTKRQIEKYNAFLQEIGAIGRKLVDFKDKEATVDFYVSQSLTRTQSMFEYIGLPDTIPQKYLETYVQSNGLCAIATNPKDGKQYALLGGLGGECDGYYIPKYYIGSNPWLNWSYELEREKDCVVIYNDSYHTGLLPMIRRYATLLAENELTINIAIINSRLTNIILTNTDNQLKAGQELINQVYNGELGIFRDNSFSPTQIQPYGSSSQRYVTQLIEMEQYIKSQLFNDLGLNANYNMKRESITSSEVNMNSDSLLPLCENMLKERQIAIEKCNEMFGWNASVEFSSSWKKREELDEIEIENERNANQLANKQHTNPAEVEEKENEIE